MYCVHPHGAFIPIGATLTFALPGRYCRFELPLIATSSVALSVPIMRDVLLWSGCVSADRETMVHILREGIDMVIFPGGVAEMISPSRDPTEFVFKHKGFFTVASETLTEILPVLSRGEEEVWMHWSGMRSIRSKITSLLRYPFPLSVFPFPMPIDVEMKASVDGTIDPNNTNAEYRYRKAFQKLYKT